MISCVIDRLVRATFLVTADFHLPENLKLAIRFSIGLKMRNKRKHDNRKSRRQLQLNMYPTSLLLAERVVLSLTYNSSIETRIADRIRLELLDGHEAGLGMAQ